MPRDPPKLAQSIIDIATAQGETNSKDEKDPAAVALGRKGG
jgi:hypothetical protein